METIYQDIAARTHGNIYIGVVGPVRTGKSTLIKGIMEQLVIPAIDDPFRQERARDELPQSGSGRTIMTSEPKFVPEEAVSISPDGTAKLRVRMIDSVGYMVEGAVGAEEDGVPRMVTTPWFDYEIPMPQAAELGTQKVMQEHCTLGLVVTTDGTITDIPRQDYLTAEARAIRDMQATGKPFLVILNTANPQGEAAKEASAHIASTCGITPIIADCQSLDVPQIRDLFQQMLYRFPLGQIRVHLPRWMDALERSHPVKSTLYQKLVEAAEEIYHLEDAEAVLSSLGQWEPISSIFVENLDFGNGIVTCRIQFPEALFYEILSHRTGLEIQNDGQLFAILTELSATKAAYDQIADALDAVQATGYGIVMPSAGEMELKAPELTKKGNTYGVKLRASAPSIHMIRVDLDTEISPMVGTQAQSQELVASLASQDTDQLWQSNIFGKSVYDMIQEGLNAKLLQTPEDVRAKFRGTLARIVNEGASGLICLIL